MLFFVLFAFCYQAYALSVKRWGGWGETYLLQTTWSVAILCPWSGGGVAFEGHVFVSVVWKYRIGLHRKDGGVATLSGFLLLSRCVNTDSGLIF